MTIGIYTYAQTLSPQTISSSGGFYATGGNSLSVTVAEMTMVQTFIQPANMLTQGFQQPEQLTTSVIENTLATDETIIYPNPTNGVFNLRWQSSQEIEHLIKIYDLVGQLVYTHPYVSTTGENTLKVDITGYRQGVYVLELVNLNIGKKNSNFYKINLVY